MPANTSSSFHGRRGAPPERPVIAISIPYLPFYGGYILFLTASQVYTYTLALTRLTVNFALLFYPYQSCDYLRIPISGATVIFVRLFATRGIVLAALLFVFCFRYGKRYLRGSLAVMRLILWANVASDMVDFGTLACAGMRGDIPPRAAHWLIWETLTCLTLGIMALNG